MKFGTTGARVRATALLVVAIVSALFASVAYPAAVNTDADRIMAEIRDEIARNYVDPHRDGSGDSPQDLLGSLDPHSSYMTPEDWKAQQTPPGSFGSIGLQLIENQGLVTVVTTLMDSPAERAGVRSGDTIVAIDGAPIGQGGIQAAIEKLRGKIGDPVTISLARADASGLQLTLVREALRFKSVRAFRIADLIYLRITGLGASTVNDAETAIKSLRQPALKGLILDLRDCPGGLLDASVGVTELFLNGGDIASEHGRDPKDVLRFRARRRDLTNGTPMIVLIDQGTASGCEIIAAALQDQRRARLVGMPTFGEGSVQTLIPLRGGADGVVKLTTAFFYRPSGAPIQKLGVWPDVLVAASDEQARRLAAHQIPLEANLKNALDAGGASGARPATTAAAEAPPPGYTGDYQLDRARTALEAARH